MSVCSYSARHLTRKEASVDRCSAVSVAGCCLPRYKLSRQPEVSAAVRREGKIRFWAVGEGEDEDHNIFRLSIAYPAHLRKCLRMQNLSHHYKSPARVMGMQIPRDDSPRGRGVRKERLDSNPTITFPRLFRWVKPPVVHQAVILAVVVSAGVVGGAPTGVTPTAESPPTAPASRGSSSGSYDLLEAPGTERGVGHDRENLCTSSDCADVTKSGNLARQQQRFQRRRQVSHLYPTKEKKDDSEVPSRSRAARDADTRVTDWLLGQSMSQAFSEGAPAGLSTWSWLNGAREATLAPTEESKKDARDGFLQNSAASSLLHSGITDYGTAQTGGMTGSWSLPIRFSQSGTKKISNPLTSSPSLPPVPDRTTRETEPHAGHQWLTTQTVSDAPITVTDEPDSIPSHPEERPPGPQSPHATKPLAATHLNTHTNTPLLITSPLTNTPRFTSYPRPHPTSSKHTHTTHPLTTQQANSHITQPTSTSQQHSFHKSREPPVNQNHDTVLQDSSTPPDPSTVEWLTFLLSDQHVNSDHAPTTQSVTTAGPEKPHVMNTSLGATEEVKEVPVLALESSHTLTSVMDPGHDASAGLNHGNLTVQEFPRQPAVPVRKQSFLVSVTDQPVLTIESSITTDQAYSASEHSHKYPENPFVITVQPKVSEQTPENNEHPHNFFDLSGRPESPPEDANESIYRVADIAESNEKLHFNTHEMFMHSETTPDSEVTMSDREQRVNATEQPPTSPEHIQTDPVNHFTGIDNANTPRYKLSTINNQKLNYEGQSFVPAGESSFGNLHYMHKLPHQSYTDPEYEGSSSDLTQIREILGQLLEVPEQPVVGIGKYPPRGTTTAPVQSSTDHGRLVTFTTNILKQTETSNDVWQTGYQTTENSPWTALLPTSSSPKNNLLSEILSQTLTFLSKTDPFPNTNNTHERLPNKTNSGKVPAQPAESLIPQDTSTILPLKNQTPNYNSGEMQGTPVLSAPPDTISLLSALTTTAPIKVTTAAEQSISCEDVGKLSPLLDFYGSVYPGLTNPCKSVRTDKESEGIVKDSDLYSTHEQKEKLVSSENIAQVPSDFSPVIISDIPISYSTYRIPDPDIVSNSYSAGSSHVSPSYISNDQPNDHRAQSTSDSTQPPTGMIPSPTNATPTIDSSTIIPYSVHFPKRNVSWHLSTQPNNKSTAKYEPSPTLSPPPMYEDTHNASSISEDSHSSSPTLPSFTSDEIPQPEAFLTFEDFEDKPTATLVAGDGSSIVVSSMSLNVGHALPEPYKGGENTKWVKISVEPSVDLAPTPSSASTSKELPSTSTLPPTSTEKEGNSSFSITSIWGSWYKRWASSRSKVTSGGTTSDTGITATTTENQIVVSPYTTMPSPSTTPTTTPALPNHTISLLLDSLVTHPSTTDPAASYLLSESQTTKIPSMISQAVPIPMVLPTTPPTSTFHATSQTTPLSAKPAASPAMSFTSPFPLLTNNKSPARNLTISSLQTESSLNKSGPADLTVEEDSVTPLTTLVSTADPTKDSDNNLLVLRDESPHTQPITEGHTTPISVEYETESPVNEPTETIVPTHDQVSNSTSQNSTKKELTSTSSPLTRVLGSLWDLFRPQKPKLTVQTDSVASDDHKNESHSGNNIMGNIKQSVTTTKLPIYTISNLTSVVPSAVTKSMPSNVTAITQNTDNSTVLMSHTNHEEKHRFLQMFSTRKEPQVTFINPSEGNVERVRPSPTKSPLAAYLPSSIESLENLFNLLGKFGNKHSIFGGHEKRKNEQVEDTVPGNHWPLVLRQRPSQPPHFPQLVAPPVTVTYRPPSAHHRPGAGISTQRPAIILKKQGSRVHIPLIPSADFSSFQPHSSIRSKITSNLFDPRPETTVNPAFPPRATGTLPLNIIRSRAGEIEYDRTNDVRNVKAEVDESQHHRPPFPAEPKTSETHQRRRCGSRLLDRLDYLLGRELVMDQFGVRVYSSVVESILTAECSAQEETPEGSNRGPLPLPPSPPPALSPKPQPLAPPSEYKPAATFGMEGWMTMDDLRAKAEEDRLKKHKENIPEDTTQRSLDTETSASYAHLLRNHRLTGPFMPTAAALSATPKHPSTSSPTPSPPIPLPTTTSPASTTFPAPTNPPSSTNSPATTTSLANDTSTAASLAPPFLSIFSSFSSSFANASTLTTPSTHRPGPSTLPSPSTSTVSDLLSTPPAYSTPTNSFTSNLYTLDAHKASIVSTLSVASTPPSSSTPSTFSTLSTPFISAPATSPPSSAPRDDRPAPPTLLQTPPAARSEGRQRRFATMLRSPPGLALGAGMLALNSVALAAGSPISPAEEQLPSAPEETPFPRALSTSVFGFETILTGLVYLSFGIFLYQMIQRAVDARLITSLTSPTGGRSASQFDASSLLESLEEHLLSPVLSANDPPSAVMGATASDVTETVCSLNARKNRTRSTLCD
ncbi:mucin-2-like [Penaeus indicus]|uniref:mucin-2-like n=1 Tax=Penaeus indicus TaxID=29960 RepID=UPI00300C9F01